MEDIKLIGLTQNNLKDISLSIPKNKIVVFTGVSGSGKSSIVFDTIAAEAQRQMNETYPAFVRNRMPKHLKPSAERLENLSPAVIVDQGALGGNMRSTVGTISEMYTSLRLMFSRIGQPQVGAASLFSFNDPSGMCPVCSGMGKVTDINIDALTDKNLSLKQGAITDKTFKVGSWYYRNYIASGLFDEDKPLREYSLEEMNLLLYGSREKDGKRENDKVEGIYNSYKRRYLTRDISELGEHQKDKSIRLVSQKPCPACHGARLNREALSCRINGKNISQLCSLELTELIKELELITDIRVSALKDNLISGLKRMIDIGLGYLSLSRDTPSLSGGEAQRLKLVRYLGSSLNGMMYIFDEPTTGMHPRDVYRMNRLLIKLRDMGNTVIVVEHDKDVIRIADQIIDIGPRAGVLGGEVCFQGSYSELLTKDTLTAASLRSKTDVLSCPKAPLGFLPVRGAKLNNLKNVDVNIPLGVVCVVTGVAGSGKSSLIGKVFAKEYEQWVIHIDQSPITATNRSTPASYLGFMDEIRKLFSRECGVSEGMFSFNSEGGCPVCSGRGMITTELVFMDPVVSVCEACSGKRYSQRALNYSYKGKNILEVLSLSAGEAAEFFEDKKILKGIKALCEVGLSYLTLGQPLSSLSGGERQRVKLAKNLNKKGSIYVFDEPTTGLHPSDCAELMKLFRRFSEKGNSVVIIEHNMDVMKQADYLIELGPDAGKNGGEIVFCGTPAQLISSGETITAKCLRAEMAGAFLSKEDLAPVVQTELSQEKDKNEKSDQTENMNLNTPGGEEEMKLEPIGRIINKEGRFGLILDEKYAPALTGLKGFSHLQVLWWFDMCDNKKSRELLVEKKPYKKGPDALGVFATRSPQRPNPLALSTAGVREIDEKNAVIYFDYIDAENASPVLDIKPYTPSVDRIEAPSVPSWCAHWPKSAEESGDFNWEEEFNF